MALPYTFIPGTPILSAQVNANFAATMLRDFSNVSGTLGIANGGTGATSSATAIANLGAANSTLSNATLTPATLNSQAGVAISPGNYVASRLQIYASDYGVVTGSSAAAATNASIINALLAALNSLGGGVLILPIGTTYISSTIDIKYPYVQLAGVAPTQYHDSGTPTYGSVLQATAAITMVKIRTPYAAEQGVAVGQTWKYSGAGCYNVTLNGGAIATQAMLIDSVSLVTVDVYATNFNASTFFVVQCGVTGTNLGEACDVQNSRLVFRARAIDTTADQAANILQLTGSTNANVSLNRGPNCGIAVVAEFKNGNVLNVVNADNNDISVIATRVTGGTGYAIYCYGVTASSNGAQANDFVFLTTNAPSYAQGTDTGGVTQGVYNRIGNLDTSNSSPAPTAGTGSKWEVQTSVNVRSGANFTPTAFADSYAQAQIAGAAITSETIRIYNGSQNHARLTDGTNEWGVNLDGSGNLRFTRAAGTGGVTPNPNAPIGFYTATPTVQPGATGNTTTVAAGSTTSVFTNTTFSGGTGSTAYTIGDIVRALKLLGLITS